MRRFFFLFIALLSPLLGNWEHEFRTKVEKRQFPDWMLAQIEEDLRPYSSGISLELVEETFQYDYGHEPLFVLYRIQNNHIFATCNQTTRSHNRFDMVTRALERLAGYISLPDTAFVVSLHDNFDESMPSPCTSQPIFVFAKHTQKGKTNILIPDCEALCGYGHLLQEVEKGRRNHPWRKKKNKAFWRGVTTGGVYSLSNYTEFSRYKLVALSAVYPSLVDAKLTELCQCDGEAVKEQLKPFMGQPVSISEHLKYKYQLLIDGNTCAYSRAVWQLFSNCVVFKQTSPNIQWYYRAISPYVHYIPVQSDMGDLVERLYWAQRHDREVYEIVEHANQFARDNLRDSDILLYLYLLLHQYASLMR